MATPVDIRTASSDNSEQFGLAVIIATASAPVGLPFAFTSA
jgi:hypothetical protein